MKTTTNKKIQRSKCWRILRHLLLLAFALMAVSTHAALTVVNGDFTDLTGMTSPGGSWYGNAIPNGWTAGSSPAPYLLNTGATYPQLNISALSTMSQAVGTTTSQTNVILQFDNDSSTFSGTGIMTAQILDGSNNILAQGNFGPGLTNKLAAINVLAGTAITIKFIQVSGTPGLTHVQVYADNIPPIALINGDFTDLTGLTLTGGPWYGGGAPFGWTGSPLSPYLLNTGATYPQFNISACSPFSQTLGATTNQTDVVLLFDNDSSTFGGTGIMTAQILDGGNNILAQGNFGPGLGNSLVASSIPPGTIITIKFIHVSGSPGLAHVQVVVGAPEITLQPLASVTVPSGMTANISVTAIGAAPLSYQWRKNGIGLSNQTNASLTVSSAGNYSVVVTGGNSLSVTSAVAQVAQSSIVPILNGDFTANHLASAWGGSWSRLGTPSATSGWDAGTSDGSLNVDRLGIWAAFLSAYSPSYDMHLNAGGSTIAIVSFKAGYADQGGTSLTANFSVGGTPLSSQTFVVGQTLGVYTAIFTNTSATGDMVFGFTGGGNFLTGVSSIGFFSPSDSPAISTQPKNYSLVVLGGNLGLSVTALGIPPLSYQWRTNGVNLSGQTAPALTINSVTGANAGNYTVVVTGGNGLSVTSSVAQVVIPTTPPITVISDGFNGSGALNNTTPASRGGIGAKTWGAGTNSIMNGSLLTVNAVNVSDSAFISFTPDRGNIYTLSCEMNIISGNWIGLGFSQNANPNNYSGFWSSGNNLQPWECQVGSGDYYLFLGPDLNNGAGSPSVGPGFNYVHTNSIVLNTSEDSWTVEYLVDGASIGGPGAYSGVNPVINYVGIGNSDTNYDVPNGYGSKSATYHNFKLTSVIPRIIPALSLAPVGGNAVVSWSTMAGGWQLQSSPSLTSPSWTPVAGVVNNSATVPIGSGTAFFRLMSTY